MKKSGSRTRRDFVKKRSIESGWLVQSVYAPLSLSISVNYVNLMVQRNQRSPPADVMTGHRSHAWVLILPGMIPEIGPHGETAGPYFLEVFSGTKRPVSDPNFHDIEAVFNHKNYWVNLQAPGKNCSVSLCYSYMERRKVVSSLIRVPSNAGD